MIEYLKTYLSELIYLTVEMAPWLLIGFIFAGLLHVYMPEGSIKKIMGGKNLKSVIYASLLGIPLPLCSCGVIPTGISFYKEGASKGSTVSFLISTPQTGVDSILATYSLLGLPFAILRPIVAFLSGILGGALTNISSLKEEPEPIVAAKKSDMGSRSKFKSMLNYAFYEFLMDIAKWLIIGLALAALISVLLPDEFFTTYLHNEWLSMFIVLAASIPLYVCATGSIPIAAVLMMKGLSPGAALVFLMAGPATNTATMAVIGKAIDKKTLIIYMVTIIGSAMIFGYLTNLLLPRSWFTAMPGMHDGHTHELIPMWLQISSGILLTILIVAGYIRKYFFENKTETLDPMSINTKQLKINVEGMTCNHCKMNVENSIKKLEGIDQVVANTETNEVVIQGENPDLERIISTVEDIGYKYAGNID